MKPLQESLKEYARGITGGLLFSLPILYTMEMWWVGVTAQSYQLLIYILVTFLLLLGYNRYAGLHPAASWKEVCVDSVEEMGIGLVISFLMLWAMGRIEPGSTGVDEAMGQVIVESMTVAIGVSIGTAQLGGTPPGEKKVVNEPVEKNRHDQWLARVVLAVCGSVVIAGNIAPTEEVQVIAMEAAPSSFLIMVGASLLLGAVILFFSDFRGGRKTGANGVMIAVVRDTCVTYFVSLAASAFMLWFFGRFEGMDFDSRLYQVLVLGFPAMLGGSAGRLLIKGA